MNEKICNQFELPFMMLLLAALFYCTGPVRAQQEPVGITVSFAPEPGWTPPGQEVSKKHSTLPVVIGVGLVSVCAFGLFLLLRKKRALEPAPAEASRSGEPVRATGDSAGVPPVPAPRAATPPSSRVFEPAAVSVPAAYPETPPKEEVSRPLPARPETVAPVAEAASQQEEDPLFKHLDLLKRLKNKEDS